MSIKTSLLVLLTLGCLAIGLRLFNVQSQPPTSQHESDDSATAFAKVITATEFDDNGQILRRFSAPALSVFDKRAASSKPRLTGKLEDGTPFSLEAERGEMLEDKTVLLCEAVTMKVKTAGDSLTIQTNSLNYNLDTTMASTGDAIYLSANHLTLQAQSASGNLKKGEIELKNNVRGVYDPNA